MQKSITILIEGAVLRGKRWRIEKKLIEIQITWEKDTKGKQQKLTFLMIQWWITSQPWIYALKYSQQILNLDMAMAIAISNQDPV